MKRLLNEALNAGLIALGVASAGMGLKGFLLASNFIDGGVTGVSMLLAKATGFPLAVWLPLVNLPFVAVGYRLMGLAFAIRSVIAIGSLTLALAVVPFPEVTQDLLLTAVFGGFFIGAGIGLAVRGGAVLDGTEIAALLISRRGDLLRVGDVILIFNVVLFLVAISLLGVNAALYSILTYVAAAKTLDFVFYGFDEYTAITIVSGEHAAIRDGITSQLGRGVTVYRGYGGMSREDRDILYCVVTRLEVGRVKAIVRQCDRDAFVVSHPLTGAEGGVIKRRGLH
ncbi:MAG: YitT family protein [Acidobacteriota bacterium]